MKQLHYVRYYLVSDAQLKKITCSLCKKIKFVTLYKKVMRTIILEIYWRKYGLLKGNCTRKIA